MLYRISPKVTDFPKSLGHLPYRQQSHKYIIIIKQNATQIEALF